MKIPDREKQKEAFHAPLTPNDTVSKTYGCRHTNPSICANNSIPKSCAFVRADEMCLKPPVSWKKQFQKLKSGK
jgi:hypothetical protein